MKKLAAVFEECGAHDVRTYIQSGNVVFSCGPKQATPIVRRTEQRLLDNHGLATTIIIRSAPELESVIDSAPLDPAAAASHLHVAFLATTPPAKAAASLDPDRSPGDSFVLHGKEIYLVLPNGVARTKLTNAYFDKALGTVCTVRNWRTVLKLLDMVRGEA